MKNLKGLVFLFAVAFILALILPGRALAAEPYESIIGGSYTLEDGEILNEDLNVLGGTVTLEKGSTVNGNVSLVAGTLTVYGKVTGNILATGGYIKLGDTAVISGNVSVAGAYLDRDSASIVDGEIDTELSSPFDITLPGGVHIPDVSLTVSPVWSAMWFLARVFMIAALAVLLMMFLENPTVRIAKTVIAQPLISGGLGLLTLIVAPFVLFILTITILLIPVALLLFVALFLMGIFGWIAVGYEVGVRFAHMLGREWAPPLAAGVGTFILTFVTLGLCSVDLIQCVGWVFPVLVVSLGLGAVLLTRLGTQEYPGDLSARVQATVFHPSVIAPVAVVESPLAELEPTSEPEAMDVPDISSDQDELPDLGDATVISKPPQPEDGDDEE